MRPLSFFVLILILILISISIEHAIGARNRSGLPSTQRPLQTRALCVDRGGNKGGEDHSKPSQSKSGSKQGRRKKEEQRAASTARRQRHKETRSLVTLAGHSSNHHNSKNTPETLSKRNQRRQRERQTPSRLIALCVSSPCFQHSSLSKTRAATQPSSL